MKSAQWNITPKTITHTGAPAFKASWRSGKPEFENITGLFWHEENSGSEDDALLIFDFEWQSNAPEQAVFEELMKNAGSAIDNWISARF
ncbi:MAG: hypothetical protein NMNS01_11690 [Nitrosomonas sp.]|nr:MAG: hypothetical protein NMNS01_11690 [Nitrosomonas sp.]